MSNHLTGLDVLAKVPQSKDEALEALDFIVNVLKEHEKDLDKLISELATVTEQISDRGDLNNKVEKIEEKINILQKEITSLIGYVSSTPREVDTSFIKQQNIRAPSTPMIAGSGGPSVMLRCQHWDDFQLLAHNAQTVSFKYKEDEKTLLVNAVRGNQIITFSDALPKMSIVLKAWLSKQMNVSDSIIVEGVLDIS
jgi:hypothetical protein